MDLSDQIKADAFAMGRAQAELARTIEAAPRVVYLLWCGTVLYGIVGSHARADHEIAELAMTNPAVKIHVETRVVHS